MSVLRIKNEKGEWKNVPFISSGGSSAPSQFGTIIEGDNIDVQKIGDDIKISAIVPDVSNLATKNELPTKTSQLTNDSNFATTSQIPEKVSNLINDLAYITYTDVMGIIASIPQFKLSFVNELPETGEKMTLYLVPKEEADKDIYNEYIWIDSTSTFELIGTTAVDLTDYVKNTDYATSSNAGVVKVQSSYGIGLTTDNVIRILPAGETQISQKTNSTNAITPSMLDYAVNSVLPTMTQAEYDALETKDENLFYMIVEE
jgi:hypothetical protein